MTKIEILRRLAMLFHRFKNLNHLGYKSFNKEMKEIDDEVELLENLASRYIDDQMAHDFYRYNLENSKRWKKNE